MAYLLSFGTRPRYRQKRSFGFMTIVERLQAGGIRRIGSSRGGFRYRAPNHRSPGATEHRRIDALRIPPAWTEVAITLSSRAAVQAVGKDAAGRWQYLYHESQVIRRERKKQKRLLRFLDVLPHMRRTISRDLARPGIPREKVLAGILRVLSTCFLRPGSEVYADQNGSYGIATLRPGHISFDGGVVRFDFRGKSGRRQRRELADHRLARLIRQLLKYPGEVFKFRAEDGSIIDVRRAHINVYIKQVMGEQFSAKDFRTWAGTLLCACALARGFSEPIRGKMDRKRRVAAAIREVAEQLGNTPAVCRASYVFPAIIRGYEEGRVLRHYVDGVAELCQASARKIERTERALIRLLR